MKKTFLSLSCILLSGLLLSACGPKPQSEKLSFYSQDQTKLNQTQPRSQQQTQLETTSQKESMKQLSDYPETKDLKATEAVIKTTKGEITITLYREQAPVTTANFLQLAKDGYYDGIVFHRVIEDFMAQVGDPLTKDPSKEAMWGSGGPGYVIPDEFAPELKHDSEGIVSMANRGPNTGGSQFFITYEPTPWLDGKHAIFGKVTNGMDVVRQITIGDKITGISYQ